MAEVKVKALVRFKDRVAGKIRKEKEEWSVAEERARKLEGLELVKRVQEPVKKETVKATEKG